MNRSGADAIVARQRRSAWRVERSESMRPQSQKAEPEVLETHFAPANPSEHDQAHLRRKPLGKGDIFTFLMRAAVLKDRRRLCRLDHIDAIGGTEVVEHFLGDIRPAAIGKQRQKNGVCRIRCLSVP